MAQFRYNDAASALYHFAWGEFCDWYVELTKPLLQGDADEAGKAETRATTAWVLGQMLHLLHPRSEEHTSELQSLMRISYAVFCLKKKNTKNNTLQTIKQ